MKIARRTTLGAIAAGLLSLGIAPAAQAAGPYQLVLDQGAAFSILGHSCGGIQEESFATGFTAARLPRGQRLPVHALRRQRPRRRLQNDDLLRVGERRLDVVR